MAYVDGRISQPHRTEGRLPIDSGVAIARLLCLASKRPITKACPSGFETQNVLMDFGAAGVSLRFRTREIAEGPSTMMTNAGECAGNPRYMSPEQAESKTADKRSDLYSSVLSLRNGRRRSAFAPSRSCRPCTSGSPRIQESAVVESGVPDYLAAIIMRCLNRDPEKRYQSAADILKDLTAAPAHLLTSHPRPAFC